MAFSAIAKGLGRSRLAQGALFSPAGAEDSDEGTGAVGPKSG